MIGHIPPFSRNRCEIFKRICGDAVDFGIGAGDDELRQIVLLVGIELARAARLGAVVKTIKALGVVALNRIAERLRINDPHATP